MNKKITFYKILNNLFFCMLISTILGILETGFVYLFSSYSNWNIEYTSYTDFLKLLSISSIMWLLIIMFLDIVFYFAKKLKKPLNYLIYVIITFLFTSYIIFTLASWKLYIRNGIFLIQDAIIFTLKNLSLLISHIFNSSPFVFTSALLISLFISVLIILTIHAILKDKEKFRYRNIVSIFYLFCVLIIVIYAPTINSNSHPFLSLIKPVTIDREIDKEQMRAMLRIKDDEIIFDKKNTKAPVIAIMIESMRNDLYAMQPSPYPYIKKLSKSSFFFDKSYITSPHSDFSDLAIWYSRYPLRANYRLDYPKESLSRGLSIFEYFDNMGYITGYISSQNEKWGNMINWLKGKGIDYFYHSENYDKETWFNEDDEGGIQHLIKNKKATAGKIEDSETIRIAKRWINDLERSNNFFLGMNLQNTHFDYFVPEDSEQPFQPSVIDFPMTYYDWPPEKKKNVKNRYLNAFFNLDKIIEDFVEYLKAKGIWDKCYFIIIGDSGEAFYEHGFGNHSGSMYDEIARTFTIIKPPKDIKPKIIDKAISHIDLFPTLLDIMKLPIPGSFQGFSAFDSTAVRNVFMHNNSFVIEDGLVHWPWKMLKTYHPNKDIKLYNLALDPQEKNNKFNSYPNIAKKMEEKINLFRASQIEYYKNPEYFIKYNPPKIY
jgi:arylsulfatase A-like enzyme